jgi:hypothetical protein
MQFNNPASTTHEKQIVHSEKEQNLETSLQVMKIQLLLSLAGRLPLRAIIRAATQRNSSSGSNA